MEPRALFGIETEYALAIWSGRRGALRAERAAELLLDQMCKLPHLRGGGASSGIFLENAARYYTDAGAKPEYATGEAISPTDAVCQVLAGHRLLARASAAICSEASGEQRVLITRCNVDYSGTRNTWGSHESYMCRRGMPEVADGLVPHTISRIVISGAGGWDNTSPGLRFVLSPRAMHLGTVCASSSSSVRGIVHFRDESHASHGWHRLHLTYGEALCSQLAMYLKIGTTSLVVLTLDYAPDAFAHLYPKDALRAAYAIARDLRCSARIRTRDGRSLTAVELQREILGVVEKMATARAYPEWTREVCERWHSVLDALKDDPMSLAGKLDWPTKLALYRDHLGREGIDEARLERFNQVLDWSGVTTVDEHDFESQLSALARREIPAALRRLQKWQETQRGRQAVLAGQHAGLSPDDLRLFERVRAQVFEIDFRYGALGSDGIFDALDAAGALQHRVVSDAAIERAMTTPPAGTRAVSRGRAVCELQGHGDSVRCDWSMLIDAQHRRTLDLRDPLRSDAEWMPHPGQAAATDPDVEELFDEVAADL